ncbi:hypothetical protein CR513_22335, partial [Mucuna pruriens]
MNPTMFQNEISLVNIVPNSEPVHVSSIDIHIPIALTNRVRTCTQHPSEKCVLWKIATRVQDICILVKIDMWWTSALLEGSLLDASECSPSNTKLMVE